MAQFIPAKDDWAKAFRSIGGGVSEGYMNRADEKAIQEAVSRLGPDASMKDTINAVTGTKTYSPESKNRAIGNYTKSYGINLKDKRLEETIRHNKAVEGQKTTTDKGDSKAAINNSNLPDEKKKALLEQVESGEVSYKAIKDLIKPDSVEEKMIGDNIKDYKQAVVDLPKAQRNLQDLDKLEELNTKLSGPFGYVKAYNPLNEDASEMQALGFGVLDSVIKIFNPSGPIAQKKLEQLQKVFAISPTDSSAKTKGKIKALKSYAERARDLAQQRIDLFTKYNGRIPLGELARLDTAGAASIDEMIDKGIPKTVYYSKTNGKPLKDLTEDQIEQFTKQGLITDVKPN